MGKEIGMCVIMGIILYVAYLNYAGIIKVISSVLFNISLLSFAVILLFFLLICTIGRSDIDEIKKNSE